MTNLDDETNAQPGTPAGYGRTPEPNLTGTTLWFDLDGEVRQLLLEDTWARTGQNAKTLVKHPDLRIVLIVLSAGAHIREHQADARVSIECISGRMRLSLPDRTAELCARQMLVLDKSVPHEVEAIDLSALLLSISWPQGVEPAE